MKKKEFQELKNKPIPELNKLVIEFREKLWNLKNDLVRGKVKNIREVNVVKKDIARVLTIMKQK